MLNLRQKATPKATTTMPYRNLASSELTHEIASERRRRNRNVKRNINGSRRNVSEQEKEIGRGNVRKEEREKEIRIVIEEIATIVAIAHVKEIVIESVAETGHVILMMKLKNFPQMITIGRL